MEIEEYIIADDRMLVERSLGGDDVAFEHLFMRYCEAMRRLFLQRSTSAEDTEDLLQETFIKVYINLDRYSPEYTFGQWVYTIARNTLVDYVRRRADDISIDSKFIAPMATTPSPEESVIINQRTAHFEASLAELSEDYRRIIEMRFLEEYSYEEIAEKLGRPLNTIKTQIRRAKAAVCKMILAKE
jgi:RNA polymerase sigma-70 factor (ECF subfamily)